MECVTKQRQENDNEERYSKLFEVSMDDIIVLRDSVDVDSKKKLITVIKQRKGIKKFLLFLVA